MTPFLLRLPSPPVMDLIDFVRQQKHIKSNPSLFSTRSFWMPPKGCANYICSNFNHYEFSATKIFQNVWLTTWLITFEIRSCTRVHFAYKAHWCEVSNFQSSWGKVFKLPSYMKTMSRIVMESERKQNTAGSEIQTCGPLIPYLRQHKLLLDWNHPSKVLC